MKIIAIDPGYDRVGVAILEKTENSPKETVIFSVCITTDKKTGFYDRLKQVQVELNKIIQDYKPEQLVMEELYFAKNSPTALHVAEARGIISSEAIRQGIPIYEIHPNHVKIAVAGHGAAKKPDILWMIGKLVDWDPVGKLDDEVDAVAVGIAFFAHAKFNSIIAK